MFPRSLSFVVVPVGLGVVFASLIAAPAVAASAVGAGTYQESSSSIAYADSWSKVSSAGSSGGAIRYSTSATASASLTFTGPGVTWYTWRSASGGIVDVYIDGTKVASVDNYAASTATRIVGYRNTSLSAGTHTIKIKASGQKNAKSSGKYTHLDSFVVSEDRSSLVPPLARGRYASCPTATVTVGTSAELRAALIAARAGSVIRLAAGTYTDGFSLTASGTADRPIWICGPRDAIVKATSSSAALSLTGASNVRVTGFTVAESLQGVMVRGGVGVSITDMLVRDMGYEGIHLLRFTSDSEVMHNTITGTGVADVAYGEGVYIGTSQRRWAEVTGGQPDRSDRNIVAYNTITAAGAEAIEAKEGTSGGLIAANTVSGHRPGSRATAWILVTGDAWNVAYNTGSDAVEHGFAAMVWNEWGDNNRFFGNTGAVDAAGYGVWVHARGRGVTVACDNTPINAGGGFTNDFCTP